MLALHRRLLLPKWAAPLKPPKSSLVSSLARPKSEARCKFARTNCGARIFAVRLRARQPFGRRTRQSARQPVFQRQPPLLRASRVDSATRRRAPPWELPQSSTYAHASAPLPKERASVARPALHHRNVRVGRSRERASVARSVARPALHHRSVQLDRSQERASVARSVARPALHRSVRVGRSPERASVARSVARPALHRSVRVGRSPERASVARSVARPAHHRSVRVGRSQERASVARPALDRSASGVESDKRGWLGPPLEALFWKVAASL